MKVQDSAQHREELYVDFGDNTQGIYRELKQRVVEAVEDGLLQAG